MPLLIYKMKPYLFKFGIMLVDDDQSIIAQHQILIENRGFRRQTPGRLYQILAQNSLVANDEPIDAALKSGTWPSKADISSLVALNPDDSNPLSVAQIDVAYSAEEASRLWGERRPLYTTESGLYVILLDHDMPGKTGLELAEEWRAPSNGQNSSGLPYIVFYTGKGAMLEDALRQGYNADLGTISSTGLAEGVLQKGVSAEGFNNLMWGLLERRVKELAGQAR